MKKIFLSYLLLTDFLLLNKLECLKKQFIVLVITISCIASISHGQNVTLLYNNYEGAKTRITAVKTSVLKKIKGVAFAADSRIQFTEIGDLQQKMPKQKISIDRANDISEAMGTSAKSPLPSKVFEPLISQSIDPHIAVGRNYIVITNYDDIGFFDKAGTPLTAKANGLATRINADDFFETFFDPINEIMELDKLGPAYQINEFYDLRVIYDDNSRRFFIIAGARNQLWPKGDPNTPEHMKKYSRRVVAFAVSKTEDPRDGFYQYLTTENNYRDWPRIAVSGNHLLIANDAEDGMGNGPVAYVVLINDMKAGKPKPAAIKFYSSDVFGFKNVNVAASLDNNFGFSCLLHTSGDNLTVIYFENNASLTSTPLLKKVSVKLNSDIGFISNGAYIRNSKLYFTYQYQVTPAAANVVQARYKIRYVKLPIVTGGVNLMVAASGSGVLQTGFGRNAPEDDPQDLVSYEEPEIAVNRKGDFLIGYGRTPVRTKNTLFPEVRYTVFYHNENEHRRSTLLKKGESTAQYVPHSKYLHYSSATADPADDSFWMIHVYAANTGSYRVIVGNIKP